MSLLMYADGYVRIKIWGGSAERFIVLSSRKQIFIWDIEARGKYVFANMRLRDFYQCKKIAKKAGIRAVVVERHGLPFLMPKIWKRSFFVAGFGIFVGLWLVSTNMLLHIRLQGNYSISENVFMDFLQEQGIHVGMWKKDIPLEELEKEIRKEFDLITWTSGKLDGTVLIIDIKENEKIMEEKEGQTTRYGSSIYAAADGVIQNILVQYGVPKVKKGDQVKTGDLLVDGQVPFFNEDQTIAGYQYYDASAVIGIETVVPVEYTLPLVYLKKEYTGRINTGSYFSVGQKIYRNNWGDRKFQYRDLVVQPRKTVTFENLVLGTGQFQVHEYVNVEKEYTLEEAKKLLEEEFLKSNARLIEKGVQILEKDVTIELIMDQWTLKGTMRVIMPAIERRLKEIPEDIDDSEGI